MTDFESAGRWLDSFRWAAVGRWCDDRIFAVVDRWEDIMIDFNYRQVSPGMMWRRWQAHMRSPYSASDTKAFFDGLNLLPATSYNTAPWTQKAHLPKIRVQVIDALSPELLRVQQSLESMSKLFRESFDGLLER